MSKCFSAEFPRALDFEPWCRELVQRFRKQHSVVCLLIHFTISIITETSNNHPFLPLLIGDMRRSVKQSLAVGVLCL